MIRLALSIKPGAVVGYAGESWVIQHHEDTERVCAMRSSDGRRDFLQVSALTAPPDGAGDDEPVAVEEDSAGDERVHGRTGAWRAKLRQRVVRASALTELEQLKRKAETDAQDEEFEELVQAGTAETGAERGALVRAFAEKHGVSIQTAYRKRAIAQESDSADSLNRAVRSDRGQLRLKPEQLKVIEKFIREKRFVAEKRTMPTLKDQINKVLKDAKQKRVSLRTLYNVEKKMKTAREALLSEGRKEQVRNEYGTKVGHLPDAEYPLQTIQIDHTPTQIVFIDEVERKPIGDMWLTIVIDCFSRMVLGFCLSLGAPSTLSTGVALAMAFLPKDEYLKSVGVSGKWPCWGYPRLVLVDNAVELNGHMMQYARHRFRFRLRDRPVDKPEFGAHVESAFNTFMNELRTVPGTKFSNPEERAEYDSEGRSIMTPRAFERYFTEFLVNGYHLSEHSGEGMRRRAPIQAWYEGIFVGDQRPPVGLPDPPANPERLRIGLLPVTHRVVSRDGVGIFTYTYFSVELAQLSARINANAPREERLYEVRYDPRNIFKIWIYDRHNDVYIPAQVQNVSWTSRSLWVHKALRARLGRPADVFEDQRAESIERRDEIKKSEKRLTIARRRELEAERQRAAGALTKPDKSTKPPPREHVAPDKAAIEAMRQAMKFAPSDDLVRAAAKEPKK